ncbi:hypothetical protein MCOR27_009344 [Pyricularia oryzae]|uniref:Uncharacterized protein n=1 Tax=Pyricularia grisea TaxID=148305 RepID=A0ABQ8NQD3_PYRGI|nr:hypothetical protein MCOR01_009199 [Pyricularia oryzae]KAI6299296.1 hypothetical protein MCOR33_004764 [Pyricularia grisea]KAI6254919.1 hypothetical protein MCOR19_008584 [Pyricularia oryzae]KAI6269703.1 hypothetical protein MCOR26_008584 [Pyricularia oryzae]KAI6270346.1 hypothetical protein MCOR27_009344 [Pyricularia oryzae]
MNGLDEINLGEHALAERDKRQKPNDPKDEEVRQRTLFCRVFEIGGIAIRRQDEDGNAV